MGPRLGAVPDGRRIATEFGHTGLFVATLGIRKFAESARAYKKRRKSSPQQGEAARWLLLVSCVGEPDFSTTTAIPFWRQSTSPRDLNPDRDGRRKLQRQTLSSDGVPAFTVPTQNYRK